MRYEVLGGSGHNGERHDVEKYLSGFTKVDDNRYSMKIFFEIRKQKYLEALDKKVESFWTIDGFDLFRTHFLLFLEYLLPYWATSILIFVVVGLCIIDDCRRDRAKAVEILVKDLKVFAAFNDDLFKEISQLLTLEIFRYEVLR